MCLESMLGDGETPSGRVQVQSQILNLTMQLHDMVKANVVCENVYCIICHTESRHRNEFPTLGSYMSTGVANPFPTRPQT
jgi:hypothetical protein